MIGRAIAKSTSGGTGVGPGASKYRLIIDESSWGWENSAQLEWGGRTIPLPSEECQGNNRACLTPLVSSSIWIDQKFSSVGM
jgi:hypothetical protein